MNITIIQNKTKGAAVIQQEGTQLAEMTFSIAGPSLIIIDHTDVHESLKGQGVGKKLLLKIIEKARAENIKILPLCPFAKSIFDKDVSLHDVLR